MGVIMAAFAVAAALGVPFGLFLAQNQTAEAARTLEKFLSLYPETPAADMALLLRIRFALQEYAAAGTKTASPPDLTKCQ